MFEFKDIPKLSDGELELQLDRLMPAKFEIFKVPAYYFKIIKSETKEEVGTIEIRIGENEFIFYAGNIGYQVYPKFRGHYYASKACSLVKEVALLHGMDTLNICCLPANIPSNKTIIHLGAKYLGVYLIPFYHEMYAMGIDKVNIYKWEIQRPQTMKKAKRNWFGF